MEQKTKVSITNIESNGRIFVLLQTYIEYDGQDIPLENFRLTLAPGQLEHAKEVLPENLFNAVKAIWTPEVIAVWDGEQKKLRAEAGSE